jgi:hypothetical protein
MPNAAASSFRGSALHYCASVRTGVLTQCISRMAHVLFGLINGSGLMFDNYAADQVLSSLGFPLPGRE